MSAASASVGYSPLASGNRCEHSTALHSTDQHDNNSDSDSVGSPPSYNHKLDNLNLPPPESNPHRVFKGVNLLQASCQSFLQCRTGLAEFCRLSLIETTSTMQQPSAALWPVPLPRWRWTACKSLGPKRRARKRRHAIVARFVQLSLASLNWEMLGRPLIPLPEARLGFPCSEAQHEIIEHLEDMAWHFLAMDNFAADDLGRFQSKYQGIINMLQELPQCKLTGKDLLNTAISLHQDFDSYHGHFGRTHVETEKSSDHDCTFATRLAAPVSGAGRVEADRIKWDNPPSFEAEAFLSNPVIRNGFLDPESLRLPPELWPKSKPAKVHCDRKELLRLAERWDALGAIRLMPSREKPWEEAVGLFTVPKDAIHDRLIVNPQNINSRMFSVSEFTRFLAPGSMLSLLHLDSSDVFRFNADDLTDYYYTFKVTSARARRNAIRCKFKASELRHLKCFKPEHETCGDLLICLSTLAMGDSIAVEVAQQAHHNVLARLCGAMLDSETMRYRAPVPRSDFIELLAIDDHVGIQRLRREDYPTRPSLRDTLIFDRSEQAYKAVGLVQHERKRKRNLLRGSILGADFDGDKGRVMASRARIAVLSLVSLAIVRLGTCTKKLLSIIVGCWVHVLLYRRVLFSVMDSLFREGSDHHPDEVFCISRQSLNELQTLAILGPFAQSDLRAEYSPFLFCMDASPTGGAICRADIGPKAAEEIWRHTEQRGFYTKLQSPVSEILSEHGIEPLASEIISGHDQDKITWNDSPIPQPLKEGFLFDAIELFRGVGSWSAAHSRQKLRVHDGIDIDGRRLRCGDILNMSTFRELTALALRGVCRDWHAGILCVAFGTLRRPQVRNKEFPFGFDPNDPFTAKHNKIARRAAIILTLAMQYGAFISVEQPRGSRMFLLHCFKVLIQMGCVISHYDFCCFGSAFQKPSKWLHNKPWLVSLECKCDCNYKGNHFVVHGSFTKASIEDFRQRCRPDILSVYGVEPSPGDRVSSFSAAYPLRLMESMASGLKSAISDGVSCMPEFARKRSLEEVNLSLDDSCSIGLPEKPFEPRRWFEDPEWITEMCESLEFREMYRFQFRRAGHINVNETRVYKSWLKSMAKTHRNSRFTGLLDSRVTLGAAAKGRSSSYAISRVLQGCVGHVIGGNLYPGGLRCYSKHNKADAPSRGRPVEKPTKEQPLWLKELRKGDYQKFDAVVTSSRISRNPARWLRFLLLLAGDIERNPGPGLQRGERLQRGPLDLNVGFAADTSLRMKKCVDAFAIWVERECDISWKALTSSVDAVGHALRAYGLYLFSEGYPRYLLVYAITGMQDLMPETKYRLGGAWQVDRKWQHHEPGQCRAVLPAIAIRAVATIGALWGACKWSVLVLLGFSAMLHPGELILLCRRDLVFPSDVANDMACMFIHLQNPKTARFARRQHARIDDSQVIRLAEAAFGSLDLGSRLFPGSMASFRRFWNSVMQRLGIPFKQSEKGATPGSLRGSGATYMYTCTQDIPLIAWRGRWARTKTLEFYLQEVAAQLLLHELHPSSRSSIETLSRFSWAVLCKMLDLAEQ